MVERIPLLRIEMIVEEHNTKEPADPDKPDTFEGSLKAPKKTLKVGMEDAQAKMKIKALDDIVKHNFPLYGQFEILVFSIKKKAVVESPKTVPTTLPEH